MLGSGSADKMTETQILEKAQQFAQYRDTKQVSLVGKAIPEFLYSLTAEELRSLFSRLDKQVTTN